MNDKTLKEVCKIGSPGCCRYITVSASGFECVKLDPAMKRVIDARVESGKFNATGDNCEGSN